MDQEQLFCSEVDNWVERGWLVPHNPEVHGKPLLVLPLLAVVQGRKESMPVRLCLDYRHLNDLIKSNPGVEPPVCAEKLRKWRVEGNGANQIIDLRKAYLQIHVSTELAKFQTTVSNG